jgi:hypothetical protein
MNKELQTVQDRKANVELELRELERRRLELQQEAGDLAITERTLARLLHVNLPMAPLETAPDVAVRKKPKNIPSVYVMTITLLRESGSKGLEPQEIVAFVRQRWWPAASSNDINPTLWRLSKHGKLRKEDGRYFQPIGTQSDGSRELSTSLPEAAE